MAMSDAKSPQDLTMNEILTAIRRRINEDDAAGTGRAAAGQGATPEPLDDVLELTAALNEDGSVRELPPAGSAQYGVRSAAPAPASETPPAGAGTGPPPDPATGGPLVSEAATVAAAAGFTRLTAELPREHPAEAPRVGDRPLDEVVRELLRPLLKTWLDANLPGMVERLVQAEIERIARRD
jgi:cell pole-organizing protein PopZ